MKAWQEGQFDTDALRIVESRSNFWGHLRLAFARSSRASSDRERQHIANDTAVLLSSDHGFFLGEHHLYDKRLVYEPSIRVPMMVRYPGRVKAGYEELTAHLKERLAALRAETHDTYEYKPSGIPKHWDLGVQTESGLKQSK